MVAIKLGTSICGNLEPPGTRTELVANGDFDTDLTGWTSHAQSGTIAQDAGTVKLTQGGSSQWIHVFQAITTVVGRTYTYSADLVSNSSTGAYDRFFIRSAIPTAGAAAVGDLVNGIANDAAHTYTGTFVATGTTTYIGVESGHDAANWAKWDNISVL